MTPPPSTIAYVAHIMLIYNKQHTKIVRNCCSGCFRDFQGWLRSFSQ